MLRFFKRTLAWSGATGLLGALAFALPAQAGSGVHLKCMNAVGQAKTNPRMSAAFDKSRYILTLNNMVCTGIEAPPVKAVTVTASITSTGELKTTACTTGKWTSDNPGGIVVNQITVSNGSKVGAAGYEALLEDLKYQIEFVAGAGTLYWHNSAGKTPVPVPKPLEGIYDREKPYGEKANYLGGTAKILPASDFLTGPKAEVPPAGMCTKAFDFRWTIDISDPEV